MSTIKAMLLSVGGTPEPLLKSIEHHQPQFVCFFASQATNDITTRVRDSLKKEPTIMFATELVDNENDLLECHQKAEKAVARIRAGEYPKDQVVVDYTGGTKNMSVALALAAIEQGFLFSYVGGSRRTKDGMGTVESGHEKIYTHLNPWDFMAVKERRQVALFFNSCQFKACRETLNNLAEYATARKSLYRKLSYAVDAFYNWDLFRHVGALESFKKARLEELAEDNDGGVARFAGKCQNLLPTLDLIISCSDKGKKPCRAIALDLYANAERRFAEGKIDDAILRLYRLVEMLAQQKLREDYEINVSDIRPEQIPEQIQSAYIEKYKDSRTGLIKLPQSPAYQLLKELGDPLGAAFTGSAGRFADLQLARNTSYLAHGFQSSKDSVYEKLRDFIIELGAIDPAGAPVFPNMAL